MSTRYFIRKSCRDSRSPYMGPTLLRAGLKSRWYTDREEAQRDADALTSFNRVGFVVEASSDPHRPGELYREGHEYVVCDECGTHILLDEIEWQDHHGDTQTWDFTCDWDPCEAEFVAVVHRPQKAITERAQREETKRLQLLKACKRLQDEIDEARRLIREGCMPLDPSAPQPRPAGSWELGEVAGLQRALRILEEFHKAPAECDAGCGAITYSNVPDSWTCSVCQDCRRAEDEERSPQLKRKCGHDGELFGVCPTTNYEQPCACCSDCRSQCLGPMDEKKVERYIATLRPKDEDPDATETFDMENP